jgi:Domain of unknown function (DUF4398)
VQAAGRGDDCVGEIERTCVGDAVAQHDREELVVAERAGADAFELLPGTIVSRDRFHGLALYFFGVRVIPIGLLLLALAGCSEPPQKELDEARSAIDAAQAAGATTYAPEEFAGATAALEKAKAAVDQRDYRQALNYAIDARQRAIEASRVVPEARTHASAAAEAEMKAIRESMAHLESVLRAAGDAGVAAQELLAPHETLEAAKGVLQEARTTLDARKYAEAVTLLRGVREKLDAAAKTVSSIPQRGKGKRRSG